jgi:outer membrane protein OmpA-like peptidoglycan-associated protein
MGLVVVAGGSWWSVGRIEHDLQARTRVALAAAGVDAAVRFSGRDATVSGTLPASGQVDLAVSVVRQVWGVRRVSSRLTVAPRPVGTAGNLAPAPTPLAGAGTGFGGTGTVPGPAPVLVWPQGSIGFPSGGADLSGAGQAYLDSVAVYLRQTPTVDVVIGGHSDNVGSPDQNRVLSQQRADVVAGYLAAHGVGTGRLATESYGDTRPVASNSTPVGRAVNRRVELVFREGS